MEEAANEIGTCKGVKVTNTGRDRKVGIVAKDIEALSCKSREKYQIPDMTVRFCLEEDGTEVDNEFYKTLLPGTVIMMLRDGEEWVGCSNGSSNGSSNGNSSTESKRKAEESSADAKMMKLIEYLRRKKPKNSSGAGETSSKKDRLLSIQVGWMNFSFKEDRYKLIKATRDKPNSGPRLMKLDASHSFEVILKTIKKMFFPNKRSPIGHEKKYIFCVGNFNGEIIEPSLTLGEYVSGMSKPRIYLLSKQNTLLSILTDTSSSSDSDFELPKINVKGHAARTATVTAPTVENSILAGTSNDFGMPVGQSIHIIESTPEQGSSIQMPPSNQMQSLPSKHSMFLVILFTDDDGLAVIPEKWVDLDGRNCALWPPYKSTTRVMNAVKHQELPGDDWSSYPYKEMYRCESYDKARRKLTLAEANSDLQTATDDDDEYDDTEENRRSKRPRRERDLYSDDDMVEKTKTSKKSTNEQTKATKSPTAQKETSSTSTNVPFTLPRPPARLPQASARLDIDPVTPPSHSSPHVARDVRLFTVLEKMMAEQRDQRRILNQIREKLETVTDDGAGGLPEGIAFPVKSAEELANLEDFLHDKSTFASVVTHLSIYGGHNLKQTITRLLKETVCSRLAEKYNFLGKKGKLPFGCLKLNAVLYKCVQKNSATKKTNLKEFEDAVKEWLRGAKDRDGGRKNRSSTGEDGGNSSTSQLSAAEDD